MSKKPSVEQIAQKLDMPVKEIVDILCVGRSDRDESNGNGETDLLDIIEDKNQKLPDVLAEEEALKNDVRSVVRTLKQQESEVIVLYFGW